MQKLIFRDSGSVPLNMKNLLGKVNRPGMFFLSGFIRFDEIGKKPSADHWLNFII